MANRDFSDVNARLRNNPQYQAALRGDYIPGAPFPRPANASQREQNARWVAQQAGVSIEGGAFGDNGELYDPNADHWYSDPRVLGPAAVAASGGIGMLMGPSAAAQGTTAGLGQYGADVAAANEFAPMAALPSAQAVPTGVAMNAVPGAATSAGLGGGAAAAGAGGAGSAISRLLGDGNWRDLAGLGLAGVGAANSLRTPSANASLERMLGLAEQRVTDSKPLFDALNTMALAGLPKYARGEQ